MSQRCDGRRDCLKDGSDELDCPTISSTPTPLSTNFILDPKAFCIDFENLLFQGNAINSNLNANLALRNAYRLVNDAIL